MLLVSKTICLEVSSLKVVEIRVCRTCHDMNQVKGEALGII